MMAYTCCPLLPCALEPSIRRVMAMRGGFAEIGRRARKVYEENFTIEAFDGNIRKFIC